MAEQENQLKRGQGQSSQGAGKKRHRHHHKNAAAPAAVNQMKKATPLSASPQLGEHKKKRKRRRHKKHPQPAQESMQQPVQQSVEPEVPQFDQAIVQPEQAVSSPFDAGSMPAQPETAPFDAQSAPFDQTEQQPVQQEVSPFAEQQPVQQPIQPEVSPFDQTQAQPDEQAISSPFDSGAMPARPEPAAFDVQSAPFDQTEQQPVQQEVSPFAEPQPEQQPIQSEVSPFDQTPAQPVQDFNGQPTSEPIQPEVSPFDQTPAQPVQDFNAQPTSEPVQPEMSPFDQTPAQPVQDFNFQPATEPVQPEQAVPSPFDSGAMPAQPEVSTGSPFDAQPFDTQPSTFDQPVQQPMTGDPMKDISIFPDNFGEEPAEEPAEVPAEPANDTDHFSAVAPNDESPFDMPPSAPPEPIEAEVVSTSSTIEPTSAAEAKADFALPGDKQSDGKSIWEALTDSGISKRLIFGACSALVILIGVVTFFSVGGLDSVKNLFNSQQSSGDGNTSTDNEEQKNNGNEAVNTSLLFGKNAGAKSSVNLPVQIKVAQIFGKEFRPLDVKYWKAALDNAAAIGAPTLKDKLAGDYRIVTAIDLLKRMSNAYKVNINDALNRSVSREQALDDYLTLMNKLYDEAKETKAMLTQELSLITTSFNALTKPKKDLEALFFQNMEQMSATDAAKNLTDYIDYSQEIIALKARYKALQRIDERFVTFLQSYRARIQDLEDNRQALVKGVKVYDVPQSDLNLIIPVQLKELE